MESGQKVVVNITGRVDSGQEVFEISRDGSGPAQEVSECREPGQVGYRDST